MKKGFKIIISVLAFLVFLVVIYGMYQFRDRHRGYELDLHLSSNEATEIKAGFSKVDISPTGFDTWDDANGDSRYNEEDGDRYHDLNGNGKFDPIWLAGFHQNRPASGTNDPLWARAMVLDDGNAILGLCVIDMIGFGNDEVLTIRKRIMKNLDLDHLIIASTHVHSSPDLMGMWGPGPLTRGVDPRYLEQVLEGIEQAVTGAYDRRKPAEFLFAVNENDARPLVGDSRDPQVLDETVRIMKVVEKGSDNTLGTLLNWGNHPETLWSGNTLISSDFPHYWREYMENGIIQNDSLIHDGLGGVAIFMNAALGGLMTTRPGDPIVHPYSGDTLLKEGVDKIDAQGLGLAKITFEEMENGMERMAAGNIQLRAKTVNLAMDNTLFRLAAFLGVFDRGFVKWGVIRSEVNAWKLGPASFVHIPGELYPEILNGGVEAPDGGDFDIDPLEVPGISTQMPGRFKFFSGMSNDMIGYIVPKSQWDEKAPFTYGREKAPYGEVNSLGPETAPTLHKATMDLLKDLN
ncbi:MAG: hypothetical protein WD431_11995 [Cyclobacteriaceae bacterium]